MERIHLTPYLSPSLSLTGATFVTRNPRSTLPTSNTNTQKLLRTLIRTSIYRLTRARLISVSKTLPESCPFENYNDLRRHWKNMVFNQNETRLFFSNWLNKTPTSFILLFQFAVRLSAPKNQSRDAILRGSIFNKSQSVLHVSRNMYFF